ncbi:MAG: glutaredoxin family protein [Burkholderiales bacterium]|nr:glutaredoxin family protein [Burkholderiales bacterium]
MSLAVHAVLVIVLAAALGAAQAQQKLYRWVDEKGNVNVTDTPPPLGARRVEEKTYGSGAAAGPSPYELREAQKNFPVTLYTAPSCKEPCARARAALNKRAVPFNEVQVWNEETNAQLKEVSQSNEVPVLTVGRSVQKGFEQDAYDILLDSAGYPRAGLLPEGKQAAPEPPQGYVAPEQRADPSRPSAEPVKPEPAPKLGPYAPRFSAAEEQKK